MKIDPATILEIRFKSNGENAVIVTTQGSFPVTVAEAKEVAEQWKAFLSIK